MKVQRPGGQQSPAGGPRLRERFQNVTDEAERSLQDVERLRDRLREGMQEEQETI